MRFFLRRKKREDTIARLHSDATTATEELSAQAKKTTREAKRLKELLEANGISLKIYIATGGDHRGR